MGLVGSYLVWLCWVVEKETYRCPTPRAIILCLVGMIGGFAILLAALGLWATHFIDNTEWGDSWWTRPICKKKN